MGTATFDLCRTRLQCVYILIIWSHCIQGKENLDNDFYLKENIDGTVVFESVPNKGRYINVTQGNMTIWNFSINVLVGICMHRSVCILHSLIAILGLQQRPSKDYYPYEVSAVVWEFTAYIHVQVWCMYYYVL